jgi:hypothetical protein
MKMTMKKTSVLMVMAAVVMLIQCGCGGEKYQKVEQELKQPINCATAEGDIRMLEHEKAHTMDKIAQGISSISPAGAVVGLAKGTEGTSMDVASGKYNKMIDKRIAEIKAQCGSR